MESTSSIDVNKQELNFAEISTTRIGPTNVKYSIDLSTSLGSGLKATVHPGYHFGIYVPAAVKLIKEEHLEQENDQVNNFKIWSQNGHNNYIIRLYDSYRDPKVGLFLAMELAVRTFREQITECDPSRDEVITWLYQVSKGLEYIHGKGGIHGNINPGNILMVLQDGKLIAKLADFGVSKIITSVEHTKRTDIFDFGKTIYFGLSNGCYPYAFSETNDGHSSLVVEMRDTIVSTIQLSSDQAAANDLLMRTLSRIPENRADISDVLSHSLFWDWEKEQRFLLTAAICVGNEKCNEIASQTDIKYKEYFSKINTGKTLNWIESGKEKGLNIPSLFFSSKIRPKTTKEYGDGTSLTKFLKFFRDKYVHYSDMKPDGVIVFSDNDGVFCEEKYVKILTSICSGLSVFLHTGLSLNRNVPSLRPISKIFFPSKQPNGGEKTTESSAIDPSSLVTGNVMNETVAEIKPDEIPLPVKISNEGQTKPEKLRALDIFESTHNMELTCTVSGCSNKVADNPFSENFVRWLSQVMFPHLVKK